MKPFTMLKQTLATLSLFAASTSLLMAADHGDGPNVNNEPSADITDFFVFPRNDEYSDKRVSLVLSVNPKATANTLFSDALNYRFRLKPISHFSTDPIKAHVSAPELQINCRADSKIEQTISCELLKYNKRGKIRSRDHASVRLNITDGGDNNDFRVFAGAAADPLVLDRETVHKPVWQNVDIDSGESFDLALNPQDGKNVLCIVLDLSLEKYFGKTAGLMAAVSETAMIRQQGKRQRLYQIDRMGRVETTVFVVQNDEVKDQWNHEDSFRLNPDNIPVYRKEVAAGLARLDRFELNHQGKNWPTPHPWTELMVDDFLIVNLAPDEQGHYGVEPSTTDSHYLDIEANHYQGISSHAVGGRMLNENVVSRMLSLMINGFDHQTSNHSAPMQKQARLSSDDFPFVAMPFKPQSNDQ